MNLTDNEIIKALEDAVICVGQAPFVEKVAKGEQLKFDIIDFINRQRIETIKEFKKLVSRRLNCNTPRGAYLLNIMNEVKKEMIESK